MASTCPTLPPEVWARVVSFLSFRDASRGTLVCKAFEQAVRELDHVDLSECNSLLTTRLLLLTVARWHLRGTDTGKCLKLTMPMTRFVEDFKLPISFHRIHMTGSGVSLENMLTKTPTIATLGSSLSVLTITHAAFVKYAERPHSTCEAYFTFDVSSLANASSLQKFHIHFDKIVKAVSRYDTCRGAWLRGMEYCRAQDVRVVIESPAFTTLLNDGSPYGAGGCPRDRMVFLVRIPSQVHHLYILTDCVLCLSRPVGEKHLPKFYSGQDIAEGDPPAIFNMCLLAVQRPRLELPNTQIRRLYPGLSATFQKPLVCVTSRSTPDHIYASNLSRLAPGHCDLQLAEEVSNVSWDEE